VAPDASTSLLPDTCSCGAAPEELVPVGEALGEADFDADALAEGVGLALLLALALGDGVVEETAPQVAPLTAKLVGAASLLVQVPWKPNEVFPPAAMAPL